MAPEIDLKAIDDAFETLATAVSPKTYLYLKSELEYFLPQVIGRSAKAELHLVVDASQVIAEMLSYVRRGESILVKLARSPFLKLYAPPEIDHEVRKSVEKIASKGKVDRTRMLEAWERVFSPMIEIRQVRNPLAELLGNAALRGRDPKDVPYAALYFSFKVHGVVTRDSDISEQPSIRVWKIGRVRNAITVIQKGIFMFYVSYRMLLPLLVALFQLLVSFVKAVLHFAWELVKGIGSMAKDALRELSKLPNWAKIALAVAAIAVVVNDTTRNAIADFIKQLVKATGELLGRLVELVEKLVEFLAPVAGYSVETLYVAFQGIARALVEIQALT